MLAGRMKLKNFLALTGVGGAAALGGGLFVTGAFDDAPPEKDPVAEVATERPVKATKVENRPPPANLTERPPRVEAGGGDAPAGGGATEAPATDPARPWDAFLLERAGTSLGSSKVKDAAKGKPWKVNLYQDDGEATMNRAKVDIDRDDQWDEKWTFSADGVSRKVSPGDDEDYSQAFDWDGSAWQAR